VGATMTTRRISLLDLPAATGPVDITAQTSASHSPQTGTRNTRLSGCEYNCVNAAHTIPPCCTYSSYVPAARGFRARLGSEPTSGLSSSRPPCSVMAGSSLPVVANAYSGEDVYPPAE
jgi:hypothetical protein